MSKKLLSLSIFAVAVAAVLVCTVPGSTLAASDNYNSTSIGSTNLFGVDEAANGNVVVDRDTGDAGLILPSYGLQGSWEPGQM